MKRVLICAVAAAALAIPVESLSAKQISQTTYRGDFDGIPGSNVKMKTLTEDGKSTVRSFFIRDVPVDCEDGITAMVQRAGIRGEIPIGQRRGFRVKNEDEDSTIRVVGRVGSKKASGHFRYFGELDVEGDPTECDTGRLEWDAR